MKKIWIVMALLLVGCSTEEKVLDIELLSQKVIETSYTDMMKLSEDEMQAYYNFDPSIQTCVAYISKTQVNHELVMCKGDKIEAVYVNHLEEMIRSVKLYFPEQLDMLEKAYHDQIEDTWIFIIHEDQDKIVEKIQEEVNQGNYVVK